MNVFKAIGLYQKINPVLKQFEGATMKSLFINWKTTLSGVVTIISLAGAYTGFLTPVQVAAINGIAQAFGFLGAKDGNVTGGTKSAATGNTVAVESTVIK